MENRGHALARHPGVVALILLKLDSLAEINAFSLVADRYLALRRYKALRDHLRWLHAKAYMATRHLEDVPKEKRTYLLCLATVTWHGYALRHVPEEHQDYALCLAATQSGYTLAYVPEEHRDRALCLAAVTQDGCSLYDVPVGHRDYALCLSAVTQDEYALYGVPEKHREQMRAEIARKRRRLV